MVPGKDIIRVPFYEDSIIPIEEIKIIWDELQVMIDNKSISKKMIPLPDILAVQLPPADYSQFYKDLVEAKGDEGIKQEYGLTRITGESIAFYA